MSNNSPAFACNPVDLYKIVTVRDEVIVGVTEKEYAGFLGNDVSAIGRASPDRGR